MSTDTNGLRVKVCGVTQPEEAALAAELGADYLGLNFHPPSPRYVDPDAAAEIAAAVRDSVSPPRSPRGDRGHDVKLVGVFVNRPVAEVEDIAGRVGLDLVQFHGDERPEDLGSLRCRAIKVFRIRDRIDPGALEDFGDVWGWLFDYRHPKLYGGSGESWDFSSLAALRLDKPTFIAGGLGPANVRAAVEASSPWAVDVCSGIEREPGRKDPELLRRFFDELADFRKETDHGQSPITS